MPRCHDRRIAGIAAQIESEFSRNTALSPTATDLGREAMTEAHIRWISGPVLRAGTSDMFHVHEAIAVGGYALLGEVIKLERR